MQPQALTFDLDDTLWPIAPTIRRAEALADDWFRVHAPEVLAHFDSVRRQALRAALVAAHPQRAHDLGWLRRRLFEQMLDAAGHPAQRAGEVFDVFIAARQEVTLYPEVSAALAQLAARYPLAAVSNGNADLRRIGLADHFAFSLSAAEHGAAKPDPGIFHAACRRLRVEPAAVLHVGDDPQTDVAGAQGAGLRAAWINRNGLVWTGPGQPDWHGTDLAALAALLCRDGG